MRLKRRVRQTDMEADFSVFLQALANGVVDTFDEIMFHSFPVVTVANAKHF